MPSPEGGNAVNGTVSVAKSPRHKVSVLESASTMPPINRSALLGAARTSANSAGGKRPFPLPNTTRWKCRDSTGILASAGWYNRTIVPQEPVREARACSRVSVKGFSSLIHREWLLAWATTSCTRWIDETCSGCSGANQRTLCRRLLKRNVRDVAVFVVIVLLLTALHRVVGIFGIPLLTQPTPVALDEIKQFSWDV